jgi:hypothetical protein
MRKPKPLVYGGRVTLDGDMQVPTLHIDSPLLYRAALKHLQGRVTITIAPEEQKRSLRANAFYHGVILKMMSEESGHLPDELHELMKLRHLSATVVDPITGEERKYGRSTATLTIEEFSVYLERVMLDGAEWLGLSFPPPRKHEEYRQEAA